MKPQIPTQKSDIEIDLTVAQIQVIVNAWRTVDFETFFMIAVTLWPFIPAGAQDEMNFLVSVGYQKKHLALKHSIRDILPDADCLNCTYSKMPNGGGHCYMFEDKPGKKCAQFIRIIGSGNLRKD